ncbi:hypothetical protein [Streptomyces sp. NPDC004065]|uniref:hypothetical protein n=1 Tax=Streptomyces sp. NPDC004065 TaxID=3364689 RepID=UPI00384E83D7
MGHHGQKVTDGQLVGGVMKLGKALATGVAEERPSNAAEEEPRLPEEVQQPEREPRAAAEEVPAAR